MDAVDVLKFFDGTWRGQEDISPTAWMSGGAAQATINNGLKFGGATLVQDYESERDGRVWFSAHGVITHGPTPGEFALFWFDSLGFFAREAAHGEWNGETLVFVRQSPRGVARHSYMPDGPGQFHMRLESSVEADRMKTILTSTYTRLV